MVRRVYECVTASIEWPRELFGADFESDMRELGVGVGGLRRVRGYTMDFHAAHNGFLVWFVAVLVLAGCGGSSDHDKTAKQLTIPAYASFPAVTVPITKGTPARCRLDAKGFTRDAVGFLAPSPATPPDVYFLGARTAFIDFEAHRCDIGYLRRPISRRLTATQRRRLVDRFTFLGETGRELSPKAPRK